MKEVELIKKFFCYTLSATFFFAFLKNKDWEEKKKWGKK